MAGRELLKLSAQNYLQKIADFTDSNLLDDLLDDLLDNSATINAASKAALRRDERWVARQLQRLQAGATKRVEHARAAQLLERLHRSLKVVASREQSLSAIHYPEALPITASLEAIKSAISAHQVVIVAGETGSGKTTQLPKLCADMGFGLRGRIGHTQPRRLAARSVAARIADELDVKLGEQVGFQFRFHSQCSDESRIKLMTDGILLAEIARDRFLNEYDVLIIDEAHERSLNIDFLLGYLKLLLPKRPELKIIVTSATIDVQRFAEFFDQAPVLQIPGRSYPVRVEYIDDTDIARPADKQSPEQLGKANPQEARVVDLPARVEFALQCIANDLTAQNPSAPDVLVFLPGEREIRELSHSLRKSIAAFEVLPLYARLSQAEQQKIFSPNNKVKRRVILATNVAETSVTVPRIGYVIDSGFARISRYSARSKLQRLPVEAISRASADQRAGRCGRIAAGVCYRLYSEADFLQRPAFTEPEIQRTNLASVILQMQSMQLGAIENFPFIDPPHTVQVRAGLKTLQELSALSSDGMLSSIGKKLARLPVDPRLGRMLLAAQMVGCVDDMLVIVSALAVQDPRETPAEKRQAADMAHRRFWHPQSDFISWLNLWHYVENLRENLSVRRFRTQCQREFLSYLKLREWRDVHWQLRLAWRELQPSKTTAAPAIPQFDTTDDTKTGAIETPLKRAISAVEYEHLHRAILVGVPLNVGKKEQRGRYRGARDLNFFLFPGSSQFKTPPAWVIANEIVETQKVYARGVAAINAQWIVRDLSHLVKHKVEEPRWDKKRGQVMATQNTLFYGLVVDANRSVNYEHIDAERARAVFIQQALVEQQLDPDHKLIEIGGFWQHNIAVINEVVAMEDKLRRRELLVDDVQLASFYAQRLAPHVCSRGSLMRSLKKDATNDQRLRLSKADVFTVSGNPSDLQQFPDTLEFAGQTYTLTYCFSPSDKNDGVTATIPLAVLGELPIYIFDWIVPGLLRDKCIDMLKALPKAQRKQLVPVPAVVDNLLGQIDIGESASSNTPLAALLAQKINQLYGLDIDALAWRQHCNKTLDPFYCMYFEIADSNKAIVGEGRDIEQLQQDLVQAADAQISHYDRKSYKKSDITRWDFGRLEEFVEPDDSDMAMRGYPLIEDAKNSVTLALAATFEEAQARSQRGLVRLAILAMPDKVRYLKKNLCKKPQLLLAYAAIGGRDSLLEDLIFAAVASSCFKEFTQPIPRTAEAFEQCLANGRAAMVSQANALEQHLHDLLERYQRIVALRREKQKHFASLCDDLNQQLDRLIYSGFLNATGATQLAHFPRYMDALIHRLENMGRHAEKEIQNCEKLLSADERLKNLLYKYPYAIIFDQQVVSYRWLLEELRVSLFAQHLKTASPVSFQRVDKAWREIEHNRYPLNRR